MNTLADAQAAVVAALEAIETQLNPPPDDPALRQALLDHHTKLLDELQGIEFASLDAAARQVAAAVTALQAVIDDTKLDTLSQLKQRLRAARDDLDGHHAELITEARPARATSQNPSVVDPPAGAPPVPPAGGGTIVPIDSRDFQDLRAEYQQLFDTCSIVPGKQPTVQKELGRLMTGRARYTAVAADTPGMPWWLVGIIHGMEAGYRFDRHLHNGDPLTARTVQVPEGRPTDGSPPFTWEASARDALAFDKLTTETNFSIPHCLYYLEKFNGFGYRAQGVPSPYLWGFSNHYKMGKFIADHVFSATVVSDQVGAAVLVKELERQGALT